MIKKAQPSEELKRFFGPSLANGLAWEKGIVTIDDASKMSDGDLLRIRGFGKIALYKLRNRK